MGRSRIWWNWQTRYFEVVVPQGVQVQVLLCAPFFLMKLGHCQEICTEFAQNSARPADKRVRFPVTIRHRSSKAKIYAPAGNFNYYRVAYTVAGKRRMQTFATYPDAKAAAERIVRDTGQRFTSRRAHRQPVPRRARRVATSRIASGSPQAAAFRCWRLFRSLSSHPPNCTGAVG